MYINTIGPALLELLRSLSRMLKSFFPQMDRDERRHRDTFNIVRKKDVKQSSLYIELDRKDIIICIPSSTNTETKKKRENVWFKLDRLMFAEVRKDKEIL